MTNFYVSVVGNDSWSGTRPNTTSGGTDGPFATLERARDAIRALKQRRATVHIRAGTYVRSQSFQLTEQDSGTADSPIVYRAFESERVRLIGGRILHGFKPVTDADILARLDESARGHVLQCDLKAVGMTDFGQLRSRGFGRPSLPAHMELFFRDQRMTLARWPNDGFTHIAAIGESDAEGDGHGGPLGKLESGFYHDGDRPKRWRSVADVWVHGYWAWDWANTCERIASLDTTTRRIMTHPPHGLYGFRKGQRFYFLNVLEELDQPGEYFVDRDTGLLYFWPPSPIAEGEAAVSRLESPLIQVENASHVLFRGLTLEYSRGHGVVIERGSHVTLAGCTIRNVGNYGVWINGGTDHVVRSCDAYNLGDGGIRVEGGDRKTLTPSGHVVLNSHIHHMGQWSRCYQPAVLGHGVGIRIAHNLIHDGPHAALLLTGNEHLVEFNHMHHVCQETGDVGVFYMGRDWTQRGNVIRYNLFHNTQGVGMGSMAVYLDDCVSGEIVFGNIFYRCTRAVLIGGGRDHVVENNIFIECDPAVDVDGRGLDRTRVWSEMVRKTMKERLDEMKPHEPPYRDRYPELAQLDRYYQADAGVPPEGNKVLRNICQGGKWLQLRWHALAEHIEVRDNSVGDNQVEVDVAKKVFRVKEVSPAYRLGFKPIPVEKIGVYEDEYRRDLPAARST
jgi:hypothetical protein